MLASVFPPSIGGIQRHTLRLGQELVDRGASVHVVTRIQPGATSFERMGAVRVHRVGIAAARGAVGSAAFIAEALRAVVELALGGHVQVLHAHQLLSPTTVGLLAAPLTRLPLIVNPHANGPLGDVGVLSATAVGRVRLRAVIERADAFVAVSSRIREELLEAGAPPQAVWDIPNGVDTDRFSPAAAGEKLMIRRALGLADGQLALFAGRLAPEKGVDVLVRAWPQLVARVPGASLCLVGSGSEEQRLREMVRALRVELSVKFAGGVTDVAPYTRAADLAVLPSRTEGMPVALLEAMSCAVPVVATRVGGSAEVLEHGAMGTLVAPENPSALSESMAEVLFDVDAARARAKAAREYVLARHSMRLVADRYLALYRALLRPRSAPRSLGLAAGWSSR
jgi:glycosyltransferase involved in cell wall biosynthesis